MIDSKSVLGCLVQDINDFDYWFMMSDDNKVYRKWSQRQKEILSHLDELDKPQLRQLYDNLNKAVKKEIFGIRIKERLE